LNLEVVSKVVLGNNISIFNNFFPGGCGTFWDILAIFGTLNHSKHNADTGQSWKGAMSLVSYAIALGVLYPDRSMPS
jgi:hypothetical protein